MDEGSIEKHTKVLIERLEADETNDFQRVKGYLEDAVILILDYTNREKMTDNLYFYARQMVVIAWNQESNEGESSRTEGGVSQSFITDIPDKLKSGLVRHRLGKVVSFYASQKT